MSKFLTLIGGQGQHVGLAYLFLVKRNDKFPHENLYIIDADKMYPQNPCIRALYENAKDKGCDVKLLDPLPDISGSNANLNTFSGMFKTDSNEEERPLKILYTDKQLNTPIHRGMYGNPSVGATTFLTAIKQRDKKNTKLNDFFNALQDTTTTHQIVIVASVCGGTGSGGSPAILTELTEGRTKDNKKYNVKVTLIALLPWFQLLTVASSDADDPLVEDTEMLHNSYSTVEYLRTKFANTDNVRIIFVGPNSEWERPGITTVGNLNQPINPHYIHLVSAKIAGTCLSETIDKFEKGIYGYAVSGKFHPTIWQLRDWKQQNIEIGEIKTLNFFGVEQKGPPFLSNTEIWKTMKTIDSLEREKEDGGSLFLLPGDVSPDGRTGNVELSEEKQMRIIDVTAVSDERLPVPFSKAFNFKRMLEGKQPTGATKGQKEFITKMNAQAKKELLLLAKGIFYDGIIAYEKISFDKLGLLGKVLNAFCSEMNELGILTWKGTDIGAFYPEIFAFFAHSVSAAVKTGIQRDVSNFETKYTDAPNKFKEYVGELNGDSLYQRVLKAAIKEEV